MKNNLLTNTQKYLTTSYTCCVINCLKGGVRVINLQTERCPSFTVLCKKHSDQYDSESNEGCSSQ